MVTSLRGLYLLPRLNTEERMAPTKEITHFHIGANTDKHTNVDLKPEPRALCKIQSTIETPAKSFTWSTKDMSGIALAFYHYYLSIIQITRAIA
ncbi:hypothetical protein Fmac_018363 [Flemingia macrophylla]|uniref:Uncharacterized protein n=1 Tax=Flemingia macrophylla TaxID=520843 RepID=A0ABD1M559_9FABA